MTRATFLKLLLKLTPHLRRHQQAETDYRIATLPIDVRLAITMRILVGAEVLDVRLIYTIACGTVYDVLYDTVGVLDKFLQFPKLSRSEQELETVARVFMHSRSQVNSLDGVA